jgi:hypothetical protein
MSQQDLLKGFEDLLTTVGSGLPVVSQIITGIKAAEQAYELVTNLINDSRDVLSPDELASVQAELSQAISARKAQQAITDAVLSKAANTSE